MTGIAQAPKTKLLQPVTALAARLRSRVPAVAVAYALPPLAAGLAVQTWFRPGAVLASGDLTPPVVPGADYLSHWNQFETGAGAPSFQIVWLPYFEGLRLFAALGLEPNVFQRAWLTLLVAAAAAAAVFLARSIVRSPLAAAVAGVLATLNAYRLTITFDSLPLIAMIAACVLGGLAIRAGAESRPRPLVFALASMMCAFVFLNPPHVALVIAWVAVCAVLAVAVHGRPALSRVLRFLAVAVPLAVLFNLWWVVPAALAISAPTFEARFAAAGVDEWAWTHVRGDLQNVVALTSSWVWGRAEYFPFSPRLGTFPFTALQYVPAAAAVLGLVLARGRQRRVAAVLFAAGVAAIWVMKGLHEPLGRTNLWLYENAPGFWLLREPAKVGLVLVLVYALLAALAVARLEAVSRPLGRALALAVIVGAAAYAHPFLSGAIIATDRPLLPSAQVRVPGEWEAVARYLEMDNSPGKVVVLPVLDYYQAPTKWGYYGATFVHQLVSRPVVDDLPGGYYREPVVPELSAELERRILTGDGNALTLLRALGARYILLRRDFATDFPGRSFTAPRLLADRLPQRREFRLIQSFGVADLYAAANAADPEVYPAVPVAAAPAESVALVHGAVDISPDTALVQPSAIPVLAGIRTGVVRFVPAGSRVVAELDDARVRLRILGRRSAGGGRVEPNAVPTSSHSFHLLAGSGSFIVGNPDARVRIAFSSPGVVPRRGGFLKPAPVQLTPELARRVGDCHKYDERRLREVGISARVIGARGRGTLRLAAREHSACVAPGLGGSRPPEALRLRLSYRSVRGHPPRLCVWQEGPDRCAALPALEHSRRWYRLDAVVRVAAGTRSLRLFLYADGGGAGPTVTEYRDVVVARPAPTAAVAVAPVVRLPDVSYRRVSPSKFRVRVRGARGPFLLVAAETFAPGWRVEAPGREARAASHLRVNGYANGWRVPWTGSYELTIEYGPERMAMIARRVDLVAVPLGVVALLWRPRRRSARS